LARGCNRVHEASAGSNMAWLYHATQPQVAAMTCVRKDAGARKNDAGEYRARSAVPDTCSLSCSEDATAGSVCANQARRR
jgi:hypothetical protein